MTICVPEFLEQITNNIKRQNQWKTCVADFSGQITKIIKEKLRIWKVNRVLSDNSSHKIWWLTSKHQIQLKRNKFTINKNTKISKNLKKLLLENKATKIRTEVPNSGKCHKILKISLILNKKKKSKMENKWMRKLSILVSQQRVQCQMTLQDQRTSI